eukprot:TRINITY_DN276_c0_g1_i2.p1 TRINITY_DN276_c0_g1~~TRINITY_DN276_c0_g1_i2.p1  ORF type:complete len:665 (+),score=119.54 TRINITY_DN276_c0_g1_i2:65-2059(+)
MAADAKVEVMTYKDLSEAHDSLPVLVRLEGLEGSECTPSDFCCVLDVSGSMGNVATIKSNGQSESHGMTLLDIAKHGVRTIAKSLKEKDRLCVVAFSHVAHIAVPLIHMDKDGQEKVESALDRLSEGGGTNIWQGLYTGLEELRKGDEKLGSGRLAHIMLLTDGEDSYGKLILPAAENYRRTYERLPCTISTFGFGYGIDSKLLQDLAKFGDGSYCFIPDAGFVGTCFVNTMSNLLCVSARDVFLDLETENDASISNIVGGYEVIQNKDFTRVRLGTLHYGQTRDVIVNMKTVKEGICLTASATYLTAKGESQQCEAAESKVSASPSVVGPEICRARFVERLMHCMDLVQSLRTNPHVPRVTQESLTLGQEALVDLAEEVASMPEALSSDFIKALQEDITGQATEAISQMEYFRKWGKHYLPSLMFAHRLQQCNNFKDPGVQKYGGKIFEQARDHADDVFNQLPPPKRTTRTYNAYGGAPAAPVAATINMASYNDRYAGCIDGRCSVRLANGEDHLVGELVKGDKVLSLGGDVAEIVCVVKTQYNNEKVPLVKLPGGACLTPYHPISMNGSWVFPTEVSKVELLPCEAVYNFILDGSSALCVDGVPCITLGHGIEEGAAKHPYFASQKAVSDLTRRKGFSDGLVELEIGAYLRDPNTGMVCGLR